MPMSSLYWAALLLTNQKPPDSASPPDDAFARAACDILIPSLPPPKPAAPPKTTQKAAASTHDRTMPKRSWFDSFRWLEVTECACAPETPLVACVALDHRECGGKIRAVRCGCCSARRALAPKDALGRGIVVLNASKIRQDTLKAHNNHPAHKAAAAAAVRPQPTIQFPATNEDVAIIRLFRIAYSNVQRQHSAQDFVHAVEVQVLNNGHGSVPRLHGTPDGYKDILRCIADASRAETERLLRNSPFWSAMCDTSKDKANKEEEIHGVRLLKDEEVLERFVDVDRLLRTDDPAGKSPLVAHAHAESFRRAHGSRLSVTGGGGYATCVGIGVDSAAVNVGARSGSVALLAATCSASAHVKPIASVAHVLELGAGDAAAAEPLVGAVKDALVVAAAIFRSSDKMFGQLEDVAAALGDDALLSIKGTHGIRWRAADSAALRAVLRGWRAMAVLLNDLALSKAGVLSLASEPHAFRGIGVPVTPPAVMDTQEGAATASHEYQFACGAAIALPAATFDDVRSISSRARRATVVRTISMRLGDAEVQQYELCVVGRARNVILARALVERHGSLTEVRSAKVVSVPSPPDPDSAKHASAKAAALAALRNWNTLDGKYNVRYDAGAEEEWNKAELVAALEAANKHKLLHDKGEHKGQPKSKYYQTYLKITYLPTLYAMHMYSDLNDVMSALSKRLQSATLDPLEVLRAVNHTIDSLESLKKSPGPAMRKFAARFDWDDSTFDGVSVHGSSEGLTGSLNTARDALVDAHNASLRARFDTEALKAFSVLDPLGMPTSDFAAWEPEIKPLLEYVGPHLNEGEEYCIVPELQTLARLRVEHESLKKLPFAGLATAMTRHYYRELPTITKVLSITQVLPVDTSTIERHVSKMNLHKTAQRTRMGDMLKDEMEVDINCPALAEWDPRPAAALVLFLRARDPRRAETVVRVQQ